MNFTQKSIDKTVFMWYNTVRILTNFLKGKVKVMKKTHYASHTYVSSGEFVTEAISSVHRYVEPPSTHLRYANEHHHDRIVCIMSGVCKFDMFNDKPIVAKCGDVIYIPYNIACRTEWIGKDRGEVYSIYYIMRKPDGEQFTLYPDIHYFEDCDKRITEGIFKECYHTFIRKDFGCGLQCKYLLLKLLHILLTPENTVSNSKISRAVRYIESNYLYDFSVTELAEMCNLGECMFRRCFKAEFGVSPLKYRNILRIEKAYEMLVSDNLTVTEVMELTGFYDLSYFNKVFKSHIGKSPSECKTRERKLVSPGK